MTPVAQNSLFKGCHLSFQFSIMITTLRNQEGITFDCIHQAVAAVYSARPEPSQLMLERFGFADTGKRFALNLPDKLIDALEHRFVGLLPVEVVFPSFG